MTSVKWKTIDVMIDVRCSCGSHLRVPTSAVGTSGTCPFCHGKIRLVAPAFAAGDRFQGAFLVEHGPRHEGEQLLLGGPGPIEIGKLPDKAVVLPGQRVSRNHCRLVRRDGGWRIEDQNSTNGLLVNGTRLTARDLVDGDVVTLGEYVLRYMHAPSPLAAEAAEAPKEPEPQDGADDSAPFDVDGLYRLSEGEAVEVLAPPAPEAPAQAPRVAETGGPVCPSCGKSRAPGARICVDCGIDLRTGRAILTSHAADVDTVYTRAENVIRLISWIIALGMYPVASEAFGTRRPCVVWAVAVLTILTSMWFWAYDWSGSPEMIHVKNCMLWCGTRPPKAEEILANYRFTNYGDTAAFEAKVEELEAQLPSAKSAPGSRADLVVQAHNALPREKQYIGRPAPSQLITHAFIHADLLHLVGNLLFLLVIGSRVNALLGNVASAVLYPLLAAGSGIIYMVSAQNQSPHALIGASGAIMGLSGLYLVLMPMHDVHMAAWLRWGLIGGFRLHLKLFRMRGFWVVLFYIAFDVVYVVLRIDDDVAHWAHIGGLAVGGAVGLLLLATRLVNARGGDILSGLLGRRAWAFVGKPDSSRKPPLEYLP